MCLITEITDAEFLSQIESYTLEIKPYAVGRSHGLEQLLSYVSEPEEQKTGI